MKYSEMIENRHINIEPTKDELVLRRVREAARRKAGYGKRRLGRRSMAILVASIIALMAFATALAATELGVKLADAFRFVGTGSEFDALSTYGKAVVSKDTDDYITVRVDAAYTDDAGSSLALSFYDEKGRLGQGMELYPKVFSGTEQLGNWDLSIAAEGEDGAWSALLFTESSPPPAGQDLRVEIDGIMPDKTDHFRRELNLTLGETLTMISPMPVPGLDGVYIEGAHFEEGGLIVSVLNYTEYEVSGINVELALPMEGIIRSNAMNTQLTVVEETGGLLHTVNFGFDQLTAENADMDAKILLSYYLNDEIIPGHWVLGFQMTDSAGPMQTVELSETVKTVSGDYRLKVAKLYPSRVCVAYTALNYENPAWDAGDDSDSLQWMFDDDDDPIHPRIEIELVDQEGLNTRCSSYTLSSIDAESEIQFACLTQEFKTITLIVLDRPSGQLLASIPLK